MKQFKIVESRPVRYYWEYIVEAENETEALNKVLDGGVEAENTYMDDNNDNESDFEISEDE